MFGFGKKFPPVPAWASFFDAKSFDHFQKRIVAYFQSIGKPFEMGDGVVVCGEHHYGLQNVAQNCFQAVATKWDELIAFHFEKMWASQKEDDEVRAKWDRLENVRELLAARMYPSWIPSDPDNNHFSRRVDLEGTITHLVLDLPNSIMLVPGAIAEKWGVTKDDVFELGLDNVRKKYELTAHHLTMVAPRKCWVLVGDSYFASSQVLMLDRFPQCLGSRGTLVTIPTGQAVHCFAIEDGHVMPAIGEMIHGAVCREREGPGSITTNLYLRTNEGKFINLPHAVENEQLVFRPPDIFLNLLEELAAEEEKNAQ